MILATADEFLAEILPPIKEGTETVVPHAPAPADTDPAPLDLYHNAPCGSFELDDAGQITSINNTLLRWLGYSREEVLGRVRFANLLRTQSDMLGNSFTQEDCCWIEDREFEIVRRDGRALYVLMNSTPVYNAEGLYTGSRSILFNITERKQAEDALRESQERLRLALMAGRMGIWDWDIETGKVHWAGDSVVLHDLTPVPLEDESGGKMGAGSYLATIHEADRDDVVEILNRAVMQGGEYTAEYRVVDQDGAVHWVVGRGWVQLDAQGDPARIRGVAQDITERKEAERKIAELAITDGLTGLKNHRAFQEAMHQEIVRARRYGQAISLLLLDVDHFKRYNDTFGHPEGDKVLQAVAVCLHEQARETDFVARYGGEEFAVILPQTDGPQAMRVAERIRIGLTEMIGLQKRVTASIGVASLTPDPASMDTPEQSRVDLIVVADWAMYEAKRGGRNRVFSNF